MSEFFQTDVLGPSFIGGGAFSSDTHFHHVDLPIEKKLIIAGTREYPLWGSFGMTISLTMI